MISFAWPWVLAAGVLPLLVHYLLPAAQSTNQSSLWVPVLDDFAKAEGISGGSRKRGVYWIALIAWSLFILAAARPQWVGEPVELQQSGRDLMLAVDLSGSMQEEDFDINGERVDRLTATKWVAGDFIERRQGDRLGLILFGEQAYLQTPLTFDRQTVQQLLVESQIGLAGQSTAIGDAIGLAIKRLLDPSVKQRVLILMTDGANTAGEVEPLKAAELATQKGVKIYTIGIGADRMLVRSLFGTQAVNPSRDLDEKTLNAIAQATGGRYFRARDVQELAQIYDLLDELEPVEKEAQLFRPIQPLYPWPLGISLLLAALLLAWRNVREGR